MLLGFVVLTLLPAPPPGDDWLLLTFRSPDSHSIRAHDRQSGVLVTTMWGGGKNDPRLLPKRFRKSRKILARKAGRDGDRRWECFDLADPRYDARTLQQDVGTPAVPGSWIGALFVAYSPPEACAVEVQCVVRVGSERAFSVHATPCSAEQRARFDSYVKGAPGDESSSDRLESLKFGPARTLVGDDVEWLRVGLTAQEVAARLGHPDDLWPNWPDGFTWLYSTPESIGRLLALRFDRQRVLRESRVLQEAKWD